MDIMSSFFDFLNENPALLWYIIFNMTVVPCMLCPVWVVESRRAARAAQNAAVAATVAAQWAAAAAAESEDTDGWTDESE